jgi:hypothetical protein
LTLSTRTMLKMMKTTLTPLQLRLKLSKGNFNTLG